MVKSISIPCDYSKQSMVNNHRDITYIGEIIQGEMMKLWKMVVGVIVALSYLPLSLAGQSPAGNWTTRDDKTGVKRAIIHITESNGTLSGTVAQVFPQPDDEKLCIHCPGAFKDKQILGLTFMWGLKDKGNGEWGDGSILDPKTGKIYRAKLSLNGEKLQVRGYLGVSILGRTQVWTRE